MTQLVKQFVTWSHLRPMVARRATIGMVVCLLIGGVAGSASAQRPRDNKDKPPKRAQLEKRFRERGEQVVRDKLKLSDEQMTKLRDVNQKFATRRRDLVKQETDARMALRSEVGRGKSADQAKVAQLMQRANQLQRQRFDLAQQEQKELGGFLTPVQQAQYQGLQSQLRKKIQAMREQQGGEGGEGPPAP